MIRTVSGPRVSLTGLIIATVGSSMTTTEVAGFLVTVFAGLGQAQHLPVVEHGDGRVARAVGQQGLFAEGVARTQGRQLDFALAVAVVALHQRAAAGQHVIVVTRITLTHEVLALFLVSDVATVPIIKPDPTPIRRRGTGLVCQRVCFATIMPSKGAIKPENKIRNTVPITGL